MTRRKLFALFVTGFCLTYVTALRAQTDFERDCARLASASADDTERLHQLFKLDWEHTMHENPEFATEVGYPGQNDRWTDSSLEAIERRKRELNAPHKAILSIKRSALSAVDQLNYDLFRKNSEDSTEGEPFKEITSHIPAAQREQMRREAGTMLTNNIIRAFAKLHEYFVITYLPGARETIAMSALPDGKAWYAFNVRTRATTSMTPDQIP